MSLNQRQEHCRLRKEILRAQQKWLQSYIVEIREKHNKNRQQNEQKNKKQDSINLKNIVCF